MRGIPTTIAVRVIARDGKFLGDDIGGAQITVRDAHTRELLSQGITSGGSGPNGCDGVMCVRLRRGEPIPTTGASVLNVTLDLDGPRQIEVTAYGPLAARGSANTVSATQWVYPGKNITAGDGFLLELPGLIVQIVDPPTHFAPQVLQELHIHANVAMMCGCPIEVPLAFTKIPPANAPGQFTGTWIPPAAGGIFEIMVYAYQSSTGNTGVDVATLVAPARA
jgi:hypothetical protein